jgi:predicted phage terminase large subunit-like protein
VNPEGGKVVRAQAVSPQIESGNVYVPHPALFPWVGPFLEECALFPFGKHDDSVDALTQGLVKIGSGSGRLRAMWL